MKKDQAKRRVYKQRQNEDHDGKKYKRKLKEKTESCIQKMKNLKRKKGSITWRKEIKSKKKMKKKVKIYSYLRKMKMKK